MNLMKWAVGVLLCGMWMFPVAAQNGKRSNYEPLFGKALASYPIVSNELQGATFYLSSGHGGPDPGCIGKYQGKELHEDEYAYDIVLRLGRELLKRGAKVYFIIQDAKDGIRNTAILNNSKRETCMGKPIPAGQVARLQQRCDAINKLYRQDKSKYKRAIFVHIDSRSRREQTDVFFYHAPGSKHGKQLATRLQQTFKAKYDHHQPNRGFRGTVSERNLYVLRNTIPYGVFMELGNIQNPRDQKRLVIPDNRQALANWITDAIIKDFKAN